MELKKLKVKMKMYGILFIIFSVLALAGMVYILVNGGEPNVGYALVPLVIGSIFCSLYQETKKTIVEMEKRPAEKEREDRKIYAAGKISFVRSIERYYEPVTVSLCNRRRFRHDFIFYP